MLKESDLYSEVKPFLFLPGHRKLLFTLPTKIHGFKNNKSRKNLFNIAKSQASTSIEEEYIELLTDTETDVLIQNLIKKLNSSARLIGLSAVFTQSEIVSGIETYISHTAIKLKNPSYKCMVKCALCNKRIPCTHNKLWQISNFEKHLKIHLSCHAINNPEDNNNANNNTSETIQQAAQSSVQSTIQQIANSEEVNNVLGLTNYNENQSENSNI